MRIRFSLALLVLVLASPFARIAGAQTTQAVPDGIGLQSIIGNLGSLEYQTRTYAARLIRRAPPAEAVPALTEAVRRHPDEFVRYRAFIVLSSFNAAGTGDLAREVLRDRNDRLRESAYKWLEQHPDPRMTQTLLAALETELAEFVRPALVGALAAAGEEPQVQRALLAEVGRGLDFFRSAVIDALGRHHAAYAVDAIAPVIRNEGPLQQDAVLALGRIGGPRADAALGELSALPRDVIPTLRAAWCLAGRDCPAQMTALVAAATASDSRPAVVRAAIAGLAAIGESGNVTAIRTLLDLPATAPVLHQEVAVAFGAMAIRRPAVMLDWLDAASADEQRAATAILKDGFEVLEEDYGKEQFFAATRAMYWEAADGSPTRTLTAALIQQLDF